MNDRTTWRGHFLIADFDLTPPDALKPYAAEINRQVDAMEKRLAAGECDKIEIGVFRKDFEVRVWAVHCL